MCKALDDDVQRERERERDDLFVLLLNVITSECVSVARAIRFLGEEMTHTFRVL